MAAGVGRGESASGADSGAPNDGEGSASGQTGGAPLTGFGGLDLQRLRYFVVVADEQSFTRAAERLYVAQPSLSAAIRKLERELSVLLFERSSRPVALTAAGRALLPKARGALAAADQAYQTAIGAARGIAGVLRVGVSPAAQETAAPILRELTLQHPEIELHVQQDASGHLVADLAERRLDLLIGASVHAPTTIARELVRLDEALVAVHGDSVYADRARARLDDLREARFVIAREGIAPGYNEAVIGFCLEAGFAPRTVVSPALMAPPGLAPHEWVIVMSRAGIKVMQLEFEPVWLQIDPPRYFRIELAWHHEADRESVEMMRSAAGSVAERERWLTRAPVA